MAIRKSDALCFLEQGDVGVRRALRNFRIDMYTGAQPASANDAPVGQKIISFKKGTSAQAYVGETRPIWKFTLSAGAAGSIDTVKVAGFDILGGAVAYATSLAVTAAAVAAAINNNIANIDFTASSSGADVLVYGPHGVGAGMNALVLTTTQTTLTVTIAGDGTPSGSGGTAGVNAAYACNWLPPADGSVLATPDTSVIVLRQEAAEWRGKAGVDHANNAIAGFSSGTLTAVWGRIKASASDDDTLSTGENGFIRLDFSIGTSGADVIMSPTAQFPHGVEQIFAGFDLKLPKKTA